MKILIISSGRADANGLEMVSMELQRRGHGVKWIDPPSFKQIDSPEDAVYAASACLSNTAERRGSWGDMAVVAGDRYETLASAFACSILGIPIVHIAGGDRTTGSADDCYRRVITALACVHCATNRLALDRLIRLVESDSIYLTGSPAIDHIKATPVFSRADTWSQFDMPARMLRILVSMHPDTMGKEPLAETFELTKALSQLRDNLAIVWIGSNADPGGAALDAMAREFCITHPAATWVANVPPQLYYSLMAHCDLMIGNSSAGLYEAPCFGLPVLNIGDRQKGRPQGIYVFNIKADADVIRANIEGAIKLGRPQRSSFSNPYGDGTAAAKIVDAIEANSWRCSSSAKVSAEAIAR